MTYHLAYIFGYVYDTLKSFGKKDLNKSSSDHTHQRGARAA